ncbi:MAG: hypothetical protein PVF73_03260 [Bacteroidales bacterium]|jgi:hypothetical protein
MKRVFIFRSIVTAVSLLVSLGLFAQTHPGTTIPGTPANLATEYAGSDVQGTTYMVEGTSVPLFAMPDGYYHPTYDASAGNYTLTDGFEWDWTEVSGNITFSIDGAEDNYTVATAGAGSAGSTYTVNVVEQAPAAWGGCSDAGQDLDITVVATPASTLGGDAALEYCEGEVGIPTVMNQTISDGWQEYDVVWRLQINTLTGGGAIDFYYSDETGAGQNPVQFYAVDNPDTSPERFAAAGAHDIMTVGSFEVINNASTVYTYELISINDQALRFGDFIALNGDDTDPSAFTYNAIGETVSVTIHPSPTTGPIYHINSGWAN